MARPKLEDRPSKINRSDRPKRQPINGYRDTLNVSGKEEGFHYCWVNEDKVPRYEQGWYEFVTHDVIVGDTKINTAQQLGQKVSLAVGNQMMAYLMRIPNEYYEEDMKAQSDAVDDMESTMKTRLNSGGDGQYGKVDVAFREKSL